MGYLQVIWMDNTTTNNRANMVFKKRNSSIYFRKLYYHARTFARDVDARIYYSIPLNNIPQPRACRTVHRRRMNMVETVLESPCVPR